MKEIEQTWRLPLPASFSDLYGKENFDSVISLKGKAVDLPCPLLEPKKIIEIYRIKDDWEIPERMIPFMGDMHDLLCLDYRNPKAPQVSLLNDKRETELVSESFESFILSVFLHEEKEIDSTGVIEEESWLDF